nr:transposase [Streptomyces chumphonensis]
MWVRDHLDGLWDEGDFASWYPRDGRPGLSPAQLATVCVLQFLLNLPITDIATTKPTRETEALPRIHTRHRRLLPRQHLLDGGYLSVALPHRSLRDHEIELVGPVKAGGAWQSKEQSGFTRDDVTIDFDQRQVTCPNGKTSHIWIEPPAMAPYTVARFRPHQCNPCSDRSACTRGTAARTVNFLPRPSTSSRHGTAQTSKTPSGNGSTPPDPASKAPSASSPADTRPDAAATTATATHTYSTS